jgi:hypothetical protein
MTIRPLAVAAVSLALVAAPSAAFAAAPAPAPAPAVISAHVDTALTQQFEHYGDTGGGWTGADSAYSVPLPGNAIAWIYSDTFLGTVNADHSRPTDSPFIHNSLVVVRKGTMTTVTGGTAAAPESLATVPGGDENSDWYWAGDGTVEGDHLRVMLLEFVKTGDGAFDFAFKGSAVASVNVHSLKLESITPLPSGGIEWGSAILEDRGYTYIHGVEDLSSTKYMHLARVRTNQVTDASAWSYWTGSAWSPDVTASARIMDGVANEYSVTMFEGKYTLVTGDSTVPLSPDVVMYQSSSPTGPFTAKTKLYTAPEPAGNIFVYNAKAHPEYGSANTLAISYNVNSFDTDDVYANVDNYRPRYVDVTVTPASAH